MSAPLTIRSVKSAFYLLFKSDSAGAPIRTALGAGGVMTTRQFQLTPQALGPMIVVRFGPLTGVRQLVRTLYPTLWLYDDAQQDWNRLNDLAGVIEPILTEDCIAFCDTRYATGISDEAIDATVKRPCLAMRYQVRGRF